jgi:hypothetical protein
MQGWPFNRDLTVYLNDIMIPQPVYEKLKMFLNLIKVKANFFSGSRDLELCKGNFKEISYLKVEAGEVFQCNFRIYFIPF